MENELLKNFQPYSKNPNDTLSDQLNELKKYDDEMKRAENIIEKKIDDLKIDDKFKENKDICLNSMSSGNSIIWKYK